jgi:spermidine synthase
MAGLLMFLWGPTGALAGRFEATPLGFIRTVYQTESAYHNIRVMDAPDVRYLRFDRSWQTGMYLADPFESRLSYPDYFHLAMAHNPAIRDVLVVGLGGGAAPKKFWRDYPGVAIDAVELDSRVVDVAKRYFSVPEDDRLRLIVNDGRRYLETTTKRYDLIILDAYYPDSIPFHLTTREFVRSLKLRLKPGGVVAFNVIGALEGPKSSFFRSLYRTVGEILPTQFVVPVEWRENRSSVQARNIILFATDGNFDPERFKEAARQAGDTIRVKRLAEFAEDLYTKPIRTDDVPILTDDHAPVDNLIKVMG